MARDFANREIRPVALQFEHDKEGKLAEQIFKKAGEVGILHLPIPVEYGGGEGKVGSFIG